jgi:hypothetical protein
MRCTRCDGLAVPQAVGINPGGKVVFGYCRNCLADTKCRIVEVQARGPEELKLRFSTSEPSRQQGGSDTNQETPMDQTGWIIGAVAFLLIAWGLLVLTAGLTISTRPGPESSPLGNGTMALLASGGIVSALLGLGLLVLATRQAVFPGLVLLRILAWSSFVAALGLLAYGILDYQPRRNVPLVLGVGIAVLVSAVSHRLERSHRRVLGTAGLSPAPKPAPSQGISSADGPRPLL